MNKLFAIIAAAAAAFFSMTSSYAAGVKTVGGVFLHSHNNQRLANWYEENLGLKFEFTKEDGVYYSIFNLRADDNSDTKLMMVFSIKPAMDKKKIARNQVIVNFQLEGIEEVVATLKKQKVKVDPIKDYGYGKFSGFTDLDGNKVEIWEASKN